MMETFKTIMAHSRKATLKKSRVHSPMRLFQSSIRIFTALVLIGAFVLYGCEDDDPGFQCPSAQLVDNFRTPGNGSSSNQRLQLLPFTGRDSFGIKLDAAVIGNVERVSAGGDSSLVEIIGTGKSTLLGEIDFTQIHFVNLSTNEISGGRFTYNSENGETVIGTYQGSRTPTGEGFTFEVRAQVTGGEVTCTPTALESGWGWINGSLLENQLDYQLDGWLFHHAEVEE